MTLTTIPTITSDTDTATPIASADTSVDALAALASRIHGDVLRPGDDGFDDACRAWNVRFAHAPAVVVVAAEIGDVVEAVRGAHAAGATVTVQAAGHGFSRAAAGGVLIVTSQLTAVAIDPTSRTAHIACGAKWRHVLAPAQEHGLAPLLGSTTDVGCVGYILGGGMGWLARRHGLASDSVRSFDVVLTDGTVVRASTTEHPELFWALRGGSGSYGVVLSVTIDLFPVTEVYAGNLLYPVEMAGEVFRRFRSWAAGMDERMTSAVVIMNFPPFDEVPEPVRGRSFVLVRGCWSGDVEEGRALVDEWRAWCEPALDLFGPMPFAMSDTISNDPVDPMPAVVTSEWFETLSDDAIDIIVAGAAPAPGEPPALVFAEVRHAGGAMRRNGVGAANARGRSGEFLLELCGLAITPEHGELTEAHVRRMREALAPMVTGAVYHNFLEGEEKHQRGLEAFFPEDLARLGALKADVDPGRRLPNAMAIG